MELLTFLEHKLFEKEEEDLFTAFAEDNAQAMRLQALIVQATCSVQLIILKTTLNVSYNG
ncbi:peptidase, M16 family [Staphylococcus aureus]|uniref:Peptidase, M16 family n=1 Tax=Staphylococcus aureus TaxID=1280 RepID=A0A380DYD3_STAAU|nr:peptidase, M16 family [Staphylococcus aureus]